MPGVDIQSNTMISSLVSGLKSAGDPTPRGDFIVRAHGTFVCAALTNLVSRRESELTGCCASARYYCAIYAAADVATQ